MGAGAIDASLSKATVDTSTSIPPMSPLVKSAGHGPGAEQSRTEQSQAAQSQAEQSRAKQSRAKPSRDLVRAVAGTQAQAQAQPTPQEPNDKDAFAVARPHSMTGMHVLLLLVVCRGHWRCDGEDGKDERGWCSAAPRIGRRSWHVPARFGITP